jgi:hypothetical protein
MRKFHSNISIHVHKEACTTPYPVTGNNLALPERILHTDLNITNGFKEKPNTKENERCRKEK